MQNAGLAALGLNWKYLAFDVPPEALREALSGAKAMRFAGLNLTVPHKLLALEWVEEVDPDARGWGAVNTISFEGRRGAEWRPLAAWGEAEVEAVRSHGFNTDADALVQSLREDLGFEPEGRSIVVLGAGGAGRTAALRLAAAGAGRLHLVNRTANRAEAVVAEIRRRHPGVEVSRGLPGGAVDLVLNATSLGLQPGDALPLDVAVCPLSRVRWVYDMVYRPAATPLLAQARAAGCRTANGLGMLLYQGARALELWTGQPAPVAVMRRALETNIYGRPCN